MYRLTVSDTRKLAKGATGQRVEQGRSGGFRLDFADGELRSRLVCVVWKILAARASLVVSRRWDAGWFALGLIRLGLADLDSTPRDTDV